MGKERSHFRAAGSWCIGRMRGMRAPSLRMEGEVGVENSVPSPIFETGAVREGEVHFVNLSNGAESLPLLQGIPVAFCRIQSSHCKCHPCAFQAEATDRAHCLHFRFGSGGDQHRSWP